MAVTYKHHTIGATFGARYVFENKGDCIPRHSHLDAAMAHNVMCMKGAVIVEEQDRDITRRYEVNAGELLDIDSERPHTITALEPGTVTFHVYLHGRPAEYHNLPINCLSGTVPLPKG